MESSDEEEGLHKDYIFHIIRTTRRRATLRYISDNRGESPFDIGSLSEEIAAYENDIKPRSLNSGQRKRVYIGLKQNDLPQMDRHDVVDFNSDRGTVKPDQNFEILEYFLEDDFYADSQTVTEDDLTEDQEHIITDLAYSLLSGYDRL